MQVHNLTPEHSGPLRYIHLNPVRAKMVGAAQDYPWSSHAVYLGAVEQPWVTTDFALSMFHSDRLRAVAAYRQFVAESPTDDASALPEPNQSDPRVLGDDQFAQRMLGQLWRPRSRQTLEDLIEVVCREFSVTLSELESRSARRHLARARALIAHRCLEGRIASLAEVARRLDRDESTLREGVQRHHYGQ